MVNERGFTLAELVIAVTILAIISAVGFTSFSQAQVRGRDSRRKSDLRSIAVALELYYQKNKRYPCTTTNFEYSTTANWITDECTSAPKTTLETAYINHVPTDPLRNDANFNPGYSYGYWANVWCQPQGQMYIMATHLENSKDPDTYANKLAAGSWYKDCSGNLLNGGYYGSNSYIVTSY